MARWKDRVPQTPLLTLALASVGAVLGCRNVPGDLELRVQPEKPVFGPSETLRFRATLAAKEGPVCFGRDTYFRVELTRAESGEVQRSGSLAYCGMLLIPLLPLMPVVIAAEALDVADCLGRFTVMPKGAVRAYDLQVVPGAHGIYVVDTPLPHQPRRVRPSGAFAPGHYRLRCEVVYQSPPPDYVPPLLWTPYDQPTTCEIEFDIEGDTESHEHDTR
jgi:hypothetical protein